MNIKKFERQISMNDVLDIVRKYFSDWGEVTYCEFTYEREEGNPYVVDGVRVEIEEVKE